jgi:actin-like protein 6A
MEKVWDYGFRQLLRSSDVSAHPTLIAEPPYSILSQREKIAEIMFEKFNVPALFLARSAVLGAFSAGRASAIVVDMGASCTRVTPVYDGYVLTKGAHLSEVGGNMLSDALLQSLQRQSVEIVPRYAIKKTMRADTDRKFDVARIDIPGISHSFRSWQELEVVDDIKKSVCEVHETGYDDTMPSPEPVSYELPDGHILKIKEQRMQIPELLFRAEASEAYKTLIANRATPAWLSHFQAQGKSFGTQFGQLQVTVSAHCAVMLRHPSKDGTPQPNPIPLQQAIYSALLSSGAEIRRDMCNNG